MPNTPSLNPEREKRRVAIITATVCLAQAAKDIGPLLDEFERLEAENKHLRLALEDFRDNGVRHDLTPTVNYNDSFALMEHMYQYLDSIDSSVRKRATQALEEQQ